ncbi:MAG: EAL domain-containing protein [Ruminococcus sp.]|nr:EAL domain-containing protein [Ruminococcus sp.]
MKKSKPLAAAVIIAAATALIIILSLIRPEQSKIMIVIYICTILGLGLLTYLMSKLYLSLRSSVDMDDFTGIAEGLNTEIVVWSDDLSYIFMNDQLRKLLAIPEEKKDLKQDLIKAFGGEHDGANIFKTITENGSHEASFTNTYGQLITIAWSTSLIKKRKKNALYLSNGFNLTDIKKMRTSLASANDFFNNAMNLAEIGFIMSTDRKRYAASPETVRMLGLRATSVDLKEFRSLIEPSTRMEFDHAIKTAFDNYGEVKNIELRIKSANGTYRWYSFRYKAIKATGNTLPLFGGALMDITHEHEKDAIIEKLAFTDEVTKNANRNKLLDWGKTVYERCKTGNSSYWIIVFDIDRFHIINDTCGYEQGNKILKDFSDILCKVKENYKSDALAARISGDNFALILPYNPFEKDEPSATIKRVQLEFSKLDIDDFAAINLSCSAGYSRMPDDGRSFLDVMEHAEFALKSASGFQNSIRAYEPKMHDSIIDSTELEKALARAIENNELKLYYQPKIDLKSGRLMGVEALIRWIKPDGTIVKPDNFVPVAESSHLISKISDFVLNEGCRQNKMWQRMGFPNIVMSINFTSSDFYQKDLKEKVSEALRRNNLEPQWLEVELTETLALSDIDFAVSQMNKLRELGVKLAMDDFGTGYSSLSYLQILPITLLKLDRSFITDIQNDNIAYEIVSAVIRIAKSKKIETIAEGIENLEQQKILREAGCDLGQGYLYGRPMPHTELEEFFRRNMRRKKR